MPRGFTEQEKEKIRASLLSEGAQLFARYGLKKTTIKELTEKAGIAQGTFYKFFSSKEELYFGVLERKEEQIKEELLTSDLVAGEVSREDFRQFLKKAFNLVEQSPLLKNLYQEGEYRQLVNKVPEEKIKDHISNDLETLAPLLKKWQESGSLKECDLEAVSGLLRGLFLLTLHRKEIGENYFEKAVDLLIDLMAEGLIKE